MGVLEVAWSAVTVLAILVCLGNSIDSARQRRFKLATAFFALAFVLGSATALTLFWVTVS